MPNFLTRLKDATRYVVAGDAAVAEQRISRGYPSAGNFWLMWGYNSFAMEGYERNVVVYCCIRMMAHSVASVPWKAQRMVADGKYEDLPANHPAQMIMDRPNPFMARAQFMAEVISYWELSGDTYLHRICNLRGIPRELWTYQPDWFRINAGLDGFKQYQLYAPGQVAFFDVDPVTGDSDILHLRSFNPRNSYYGMSPLIPGAYPVDTHNAIETWSRALLLNSARGSGSYTTDQAVVPQKTLDQWESQLDEKYSGPGNVGRPKFLTGGLKWNPESLTPVEMDFLNGKQEAARDICRVMETPPNLIAIPGDNTYSNFQSAVSFYFNGPVKSRLDTIETELNHWLAPLFGEPGLRFVYDLSKVPGLEPERELRERRAIALYQGGLLTANEAREKYLQEGPLPGGNQLMANASMVPLSFIADTPPTPDDAVEQKNFAKHLQATGYDQGNVSRLLTQAFAYRSPEECVAQRPFLGKPSTNGNGRH